MRPILCFVFLHKNWRWKKETEIQRWKLKHGKAQKERYKQIRLPYQLESLFLCGIERNFDFFPRLSINQSQIIVSVDNARKRAVRSFIAARTKGEMESSAMFSVKNIVSRDEIMGDECFPELWKVFRGQFNFTSTILASLDVIFLVNSFLFFSLWTAVDRRCATVWVQMTVWGSRFMPCCIIYDRSFYSSSTPLIPSSCLFLYSEFFC